MFVDAECNERYQSFPDTLLPLHLQTSRPDIVVLQNVHDAGSLPLYCRRDPRVIIHIVEVGYTGDMYLHDTIAAKKIQHQQLCINLSAFGWAHVRQHQFIVGHTGVMLTENVVALQALGINASRVDPFLRRLAVSSLQKSTAILSCFPSCAEVAQPPASSTDYTDASQQPPRDPSQPAQISSRSQSSITLHVHAPTSFPPASASPTALNVQQPHQHAHCLPPSQLTRPASDIDPMSSHTYIASSPQLHDVALHNSHTTLPPSQPHEPCLPNHQSTPASVHSHSDLASHVQASHVCHTVLQPPRKKLKTQQSPDATMHHPHRPSNHRKRPAPAANDEHTRKSRRLQARNQQQAVHATQSHVVLEHVSQPDASLQFTRADDTTFDPGG